MSEQVRAGEITLAGVPRGRGCDEPQPRPLHDDGHRVDAWRRWSRRSASACRSNAAIPAVDARRNVLARMAGRRIVEMVHEDSMLSKILTREAFENAIRTLAAIGGSTNAVVHLLAIARPHRRRARRSTTSTSSARGVHCLVDLMPSGRFLMEDFYYAGGLPVVLRRSASTACCTRTR